MKKKSASRRKDPAPVERIKSPAPPGLFCLAQCARGKLTHGLVPLYCHPRINALASSKENARINRIASITFLNSINLKEYFDDKFTTLDVKAEDNTGKRYNIEMQVRTDSSYIARDTNPCEVDPYIFIKHFGNWLRTKLNCEGHLPEEEMKILDTPGEKFLEHLEKELNPVKSYKMVVLTVLLGLPGTQWKVAGIAEGFLRYYLDHRDRMYDFDALAKAKEPDTFSLKKVEEHIKKMPLNFLSDREDKWFTLDRSTDTFSIKPEMEPYWNDPFYRRLVADRVNFTLSRYFYRKRGAPEEGER